MYAEQWNVHCTLYNVYVILTLYSVLRTKHTVGFTRVYTVQCTVYTFQCTDTLQCSVQCTVYSVHIQYSIVYIVRWCMLLHHDAVWNIIIKKLRLYSTYSVNDDSVQCTTYSGRRYTLYVWHCMLYMICYPICSTYKIYNNMEHTTVIYIECSVMHNILWHKWMI